MTLPNVRFRSATLVACLFLGAMAGCGDSGGGGGAALPASDGKAPPELPKEQLGRDGMPKDSNAAFDTAHGARPPR